MPPSRAVSRKSRMKAANMMSWDEDGFGASTRASLEWGWRARATASGAGLVQAHTVRANMARTGLATLFQLKPIANPRNPRLSSVPGQAELWRKSPVDMEKPGHLFPRLF